MPLSNKEELNLIVNPETKLNIEHSGGDGWTILHGDMLSIVKAFKPGVFDAVITDPPYASGGAKPSEKNRTTNQKYSSMKADKALPDFDGDQKDQRSWTRWCAEWLSDVRRACKPGAVLVVFIDWRMAPCLSDAIQWAGWIWRGQIVWNKQVSRPQRGRFRQQSEFALWASNGPLPMDRPVGCLPGVFRYTNPANRIHVTEKPLQLMRDVVQITLYRSLGKHQSERISLLRFYPIVSLRKSTKKTAGCEKTSITLKNVLPKNSSKGSGSRVSSPAKKGSWRTIT